MHRVTGDGGLELARQVGVCGVADVAIGDGADGRGGVDDLVGCDAGHRRTQDHPGAVAAGLGGVQPDRLQPAPDLGHVLDPDPVQLHVLPVGDVGDIPTEVDRDLPDHPELLGGQRTAVDPDPQHEVLVVQLPRLQGGGLAAVDPRPALGVEAVPAEASPQVTGVDGGEAALGVDVLYPGPDVERMVVLLGLLVGVQRLAVAQSPLTLALLAARLRGRPDRRGRGRTARSGLDGGVGCHGSPRSGMRAARGQENDLADDGDARLGQQARG